MCRGAADVYAWDIAALAVIVEPGSVTRIDPALVAVSLDLKAAESEVAVLLDCYVRTLI